MAEKEHQAPLIVDEQIQNLLDLGLTIEDKEYAKRSSDKKAESCCINSVPTGKS